MSTVMIQRFTSSVASVLAVALLAATAWLVVEVNSTTIESGFDRLGVEVDVGEPTVEASGVFVRWERVYTKSSGCYARYSDLYFVVPSYWNACRTARYGGTAYVAVHQTSYGSYHISPNY